ncbi:MAG TPA: hypothetical protein VEQ16_02845, partial [Acidocella sp.]|nr:hypothetical protein [Acidocella sp.]
GGDAGEHRSGQAERYDGWKDGSPDAHDSSKATLGPRQSARLGPARHICCLVGVITFVGKVKPFRAKKKMLRYFRIKLPGGFSC